MKLGKEKKIVSLAPPSPENSLLARYDSLVANIDAAKAFTPASLEAERYVLQVEQGRTPTTGSLTDTGRAIADLRGAYAQADPSLVSGIVDIAAFVNDPDEDKRAVGRIASAVASLDPATTARGVTERAANIRAFIQKLEEGNPDSWLADLGDVETLVEPVANTYNRIVNGGRADPQRVAFVDRVANGDFNDLTFGDIVSMQEFQDLRMFENVDADIRLFQEYTLDPKAYADAVATDAVFTGLEFTPIGLFVDAGRLAKWTVTRPAAMVARANRARVARAEAQRIAALNGRDDPLVNLSEAEKARRNRTDMESTSRGSLIPEESLQEMSEPLRREMDNLQAALEETTETIVRGGNLQTGADPVAYNLSNNLGYRNLSYGVTNWSLKKTKKGAFDRNPVIDTREVVRIGTTTGETFTKRNADRAISDLISENPNLVLGQNIRRAPAGEGQRGRFVVEIDASATQTPLRGRGEPPVRPEEFEDFALQRSGWKNAWSYLASRPSAWLDKRVTLRASNAEGRENSNVFQVFDRLGQTIKTAKSEGGDPDMVSLAMDTAALRDDVGAWLTNEEFGAYFSQVAGREAQPADLAIYNAVRAANNLSYRIRAMDLLTQKLEKNSVRVTGTGQSGEVRQIIEGRDAIDAYPVSSIDSSSDDLVAIVENGSTRYVKASELGKGDRAGRQLMEIADADSSGVRYLLLRENDQTIRTGDLALNEQVGYLGMGRLTPNYRRYLKVQIGNTTDTITLFGGSVTRELNRMSSRVPTLARLTKEALEGRAVDDAIADLGFGGIHSADDAIKLFSEAIQRTTARARSVGALRPEDEPLTQLLDGIIEGKNKAITLKSDQQPTVLGGKVKEVDETDIRELSKLRNDYSRSNRRIRHISDNETPYHYLSPSDAMSRELQVAIRAGSIGVDKRQMFGAFMESFGRYSDEAGKGIYAVLNDKNLPNKVAEALAKEGKDPTAVNIAVRAYQRQIQHFVRFSHPTRNFFGDFIDGLNNIVFSMRIKLEAGGQLSKLAGKAIVPVNRVLANLADYSAGDQFLAMMFDVKLGMLAPTTFVQQALWANTIAITRGAKFNGRAVTQNLPAFISSLPLSDEAARLAFSLVKNKHFTVEELMEMRRVFKEQGFDTYGRSHAMQDTARSSGAREADLLTSNKLEQFRSGAGMAFFKYGDLIPRVTAFLDGAVDHKALGVTSREFADNITNHVNKYTMGTTGADTPVFIKRGLGGTMRYPLQFGSYVFKAFDSMFNREMKGERLRVAAAHFFSAGVGAFPLGAYVLGKSLSLAGEDDEFETNYHKLKEVFGEDWTWAAIALDSGMYDAIIYAALGEETDLGARLSADPFTMHIENFILNFNGASPVSSIFGAMGSTARNMGRDFDRLNYLYSTDVNPSLLSVEGMTAAVMSLGRQIKAVSEVERLILATTDTLYYDSKGRPLMTTGGKEAWLRFLGLPPKRLNEYYLFRRSERERSDKLNSVAEAIAIRRAQAMATNDVQEAADLDAINAALVEGLIQLNYTHGEIRAALHKAYDARGGALQTLEDAMNQRRSERDLVEYIQNGAE